ncbi:hypothetical protein ACFDTO_35230 [Microbacteriaceae bacterium 4G12]
MTKKSIFIPIILLLFLTMLLLYENIKMQVALPSDGWSRALPLDIESPKEIQTFMKKTGNTYDVYTTEKDKVVHTTYDEALHVLKKEKIQVSLPFNSRIWVNNQSVLYVENGSLILSENNNKRTIDQGVTNLLGKGEQVFYWKDKQLYEVNVSSWTGKLVAEFPGKVLDVAFDETADPFVVSCELNRNEIQFTLLTPSSGEYKTKQLPVITLAGKEGIEDLQFVQSEKNPILIYGTSSVSQGIRTHKAYEWEINSTDPEQSPKPTLMNIHTMQGTIENPQHLRVALQDGKPVLLFTAFGPTVGKSEGFNVYAATKEGKNWSASRKSTTGGVAQSPLWIGKHSIIWSSFSKDMTKLYGTTQDAKSVKESEKIKSEDLKQAAYSAVSSLFGGFILVMISLIWIAPPIICYVVLYFFKPDSIENGRIKWLQLALIGLYLGFQQYSLQFSFHKERLQFAPKYLSFNESLFVIPLILAIVTWVALKASKKEWGALAGFAYYACVNVLLMTFTFGPYIL